LVTCWIGITGTATPLIRRLSLDPASDEGSTFAIGIHFDAALRVGTALPMPFILLILKEPDESANSRPADMAGNLKSEKLLRIGA
jgi:hypothetical protein